MKNCFNCDNFTWWDGDYCCIKKWAILQSSPDGRLTEEIIPNIKNSDECVDYLFSPNQMVLKAYNDFLINYKD